MSDISKQKPVFAFLGLTGGLIYLNVEKKMDSFPNREPAKTKFWQALGKIFAILSLIILLLGLVFALFLVGERTFLPGRAVAPGVLSLENSYLFASPLVVKAGGGEKITVSAFVLSDQGLGMADKKVILYSAPALFAQAVREETDNRGMAVFEVSSLNPGQFRIWASIPGEGQIKQTVLITFE